MYGLCTNITVNSQQVTTIFGSQVFYDVNGKLFHVRLSPSSEWQIPIKLNEMGKWLPLVAVNAEDGRFYRHIGIDLLSMLRALIQDISSGEIVSGASTITSQVIRLAVSEREGRKRTPMTKIREFIMAVKLENQISKPEILECYLNLAPFGGNIRGVQAASLIYFGKTASQISPGEACLLIGMLKGPTLYRPDTKPKNAIKRRNEIIALMERKKVFTHDEAKRAYLEELPGKKFELPSRAWHYAELVLSQNPEHSRIFNTMLNLEIQTKLEAILKQALNGLPEDITFSAGVVDNETASLAAWAGNARFSYRAGNDKNSASWVDCGRSLRSPGSTLKPFAYLSAIEQGILTPSTLLADTSTAFSGRAPRNFDLQYRGAVTARNALHESLNAPAVRVLRTTGNDRVLSMMRAAGFRHLSQSAKYYGDSLILGGCDVTLLEELEAYSTLASLGLHRPLKLLAENVQNGERISTEAGAWIIGDILKYNSEIPVLHNWHVSLKTGTSYGLRDAWACSWTKDYTVCVWAGKPDGSSWEGLIGARISAPEAVKILRLISPVSRPYERPAGLIMRKVCTLSGKPPTALCPSTKFEWAVEGITRTLPCDMHVIKSEVRMPAEFNNAKSSKRSRLKIISPIPGAVYINAPLDEARNIPLKAEGASGRVWWYIDGEFCGTSENGHALFVNIDDGEHEISVTDETGRSDKSAVKVSTPAKKNTGDLLF